MTNLLTQAAELARLLLKSSQPPRELTSTFLHKQKRLDSSERRFISSVAHHALRVWRFACACSIGESGDIETRPSPKETRIVLASSILLSSNGFLPPFLSKAESTSFHKSAAKPSTVGLPPGTVQSAPALDISESEEFRAFVTKYARAMLSRETGMTVETLLEQAVRWDSASQSAAGRAGVPVQEGDGPSSEEIADSTAIAIRWSLPNWVVRTWREQEPRLSFLQIADIGRGLCTAAPLVLRVNRLRTNRASLIATLIDADIEAVEHPVLPDAIIVPGRESLMESSWYEAGMFEIQDAGSQLITLACGVHPGWNVLDACAGGGGKTMHLADVMQDSGTLVACDIERSKLRGLEQRGRRLTLNSLRTMALAPDGQRQDGGDAFAENEKFDCVLVDAPCSGFGTVRRHPALKWRLTEKTVLRLAGRQAAILSRNADHVREGGILLYATCSLLPQENRANLNHFLTTHPDFILESLTPQFASSSIALDSAADDTGELLLFPAILDSDGFYMARLRQDSSRL
ncbi:MAG: hypothetical protein WBQ23_15195 [Bacteroidota bacterium]